MGQHSVSEREGYAAIRSRIPLCNIENDLMVRAVISQSVVDVSCLPHDRMSEGYPVKREAVAALSSNLTRYVKRFGDYVVILHRVFLLITPFSCGTFLAQNFSICQPRDAR